MCNYHQNTKRSKQIPTQNAQTNSSIDAHKTKTRPRPKPTNWFPNQVDLRYKINELAANEPVPNQVESNNNSPSNRALQSNKLAYPVKEKPKLRGEYVRSMHADLPYKVC